MVVQEALLDIFKDISRLRRILPVTQSSAPLLFLSLDHDEF